MSELRPFALLRTGDQWVRCSFERTFLDVDAGIVELARTTATIDSGAPAPAIGAGLAFDRECRLYHSVPCVRARHASPLHDQEGPSDLVGARHASPEGGRVDRILWKATDPLGPVADQPAPLDLFAAPADSAVGDFAATDPIAALVEPRGLAVDVNDRLFVAETGRDRILIYDLWSDRLIRQVLLPGSGPTDLAAHGADVYAVIASTGQVVRLTARTGPDPVTLPPGCSAPARIAISPSGRLAILERQGQPDARIWLNDAGPAPLVVPLATDIEWQSDQVLVVARQPGADFRRFEIQANERVELPSLRARGYDGLGIVATPEPLTGAGVAKGSRRIGYWTPLGFRDAVAARPVFDRTGRVTTYRLDSGLYQTVWGRLFVDACIPDGADLRVHCIAADEPEEDAPLLRVPPANIQSITIKRPDLTPPMPPQGLAPGAGDVTLPLHLRESGRELPWTPIAPAERFETWEAPVQAPPGRYLWVTLELRGNTRVSPKVRCLRAEHPSHDYLRRLPKTFSRDAGAASFLRRYLAMFEGFLGETEARGVDRDLLLDPRSTPADCLPWLASFIGLLLDERWAYAPAPTGGTLDARRAIVEDAAWLFRYRGTLPGLKRFIELYVGVGVLILEHYRLRGIGGAIVGDDGAAFSSAVIGAGFRVGGAVGAETAAPIDGSIEDAFRTHAHRFTVLIPAALTDDQLDVVRLILEVHRPAHTIFELCTADAGMRVGRGLLLDVSSVIGPTGGFSTYQAGRSLLGRGAILGTPAEGSALGTSRTGTARVG